MSHLIIKNATLVDSSSIYEADILVHNGTIKCISKDITDKKYENMQIIDAKGLLLMPGGIDAHTHFNLDTGVAKSSDDFYTGTVAAACGGTTTIIDHMGFGKAGCSLQSRVDLYHEYAEGKAVIDYGLHGVIQHIDDNILKEMESIVLNGITSMKFYMTYGFMLSDSYAIKTLSKMKSLGGILCVHAESNDMIEHLKDFHFSKGNRSAIYHAYSRPDTTEAEAVHRIIELAKLADNAPLYIVHLSTHKGLKHIEKAQNEGLNVIAETCPQYLLLDEEYYNKENYEGLKYIISPPLREKYNQDKLWLGIKNSKISTIGTDHCSFNFSQKLEMGKEDFRKCPNGIAGVESRMSLMFSEGVSKKRITLNKFVEITSTNPAKIFGLYPKKGSLSIGSDADFVLFDPNKKDTITHKNLHENVDYTGYEGFEVKGCPVMTISRGEIIAENNNFTSKAGRGKYLKRDKPIMI